MERATVLKGPWNRRSITISAAAVLTLLLVWTIGTQSDARLSLSQFSSTWYPSSTEGVEIASATPVSPISPISPSSPSSDPRTGKTFELAISGDAEDADFPKGVGYTGNVALIMEEDPAAIHNFAAVVTHFRNTIGPDWEMVILTRRGWDVPTSFGLRKHIAAGTIKIRFLPPQFDHFPSHASVSKFLTNPWLWSQFEHVNRMLMFQPDSILCANANHTVDDFLEWDYIGAPMDAQYIGSRHGDANHPAHPDSQGYNGGLCIRNPRLFLEVAQRYDFLDDFNSKPEGNLPSFLRYEDHWFTRKLEDNPELGAKFHLPPPDVAGQFSVETWYFDRPLGYHQPHRWQKDKYQDIAAYCPEVGIILDMEMPDARWG